jgi:hypothetical protein
MNLISEERPSGASINTHYEQIAYFPNLPLPPSSNNQYFLVRRGPKTFHVPSDELKAFKALMDQYAAKEGMPFTFNSNLVKAWVSEPAGLSIKAVFFFHKERVMTKQNLPKRLDCSNRIKALHDNLCRIIGIDDKWFFKVEAEKAICPPSVQETTCVEISRYS